ncbi:N-acetyl-gamma-glutamyl-phosphate reductase [Rarobacter faecitabidus]|nr:N-acetyl-gamma-glutamyl-phosphate reductase [Rarobacter faecitabidus]
MTFSVAVTGASGYAGGEFLRLALQHPELEIGALTANASAGTTLGEHHPHLRALAPRVIEPTDAARLAEHDVIVLALPHGTSGPIAGQLPDNAIVVDLGADHRLESAADWTTYYGGDHPGTWAYGLPELIRAAGDRQRERLAEARRIAVPGCNVTAVTLGIQPGVAAGIIDPSDLVAVLSVGYSGAGKSLRQNLLASEALSSAAPYAVGGTHRHIPEIGQNLRAAGAGDVRLSFTPVLVPMSRGILATTTARLAPGLKGVDAAELRAAWVDAYCEERFVEVLPEGQWPTTAMVQGSNTALVQVAYDATAGRIVAVSAIDNLVKGTAGGAIQSLNLALGLPEHLGLPVNGVAP